MRVWNLPMPPNSASITANTSARVAHDQARAAQRLDRHDVEVGGHHDLAQEGAVLLHLDAADRDLGLLRMKLNSPMRMLRAKRSLMISIVGMRPRTMRSWLARS
jgi:hypothetical protein